VSHITVLHEGRFFLVQADGVTLGHACKLLAFEGESTWRALVRMIFRPLWRASAGTGDGFVHLEEVYGSVFRNRNEAIGAILAFHGMNDSRYPAPSK